MGSIELRSEVTGNVWKIEVAPGDTVAEDDEVVIVESMKMELPVVATEDGRVVEVRVSEGQPVREGDVVAVLEVD